MLLPVCEKLTPGLIRSKDPIGWRHVASVSGTKQLHVEVQSGVTPSLLFAKSYNIPLYFDRCPPAVCAPRPSPPTNPCAPKWSASTRRQPRHGSEGSRKEVSRDVSNFTSQSRARAERIQKVLSRCGICSRREAEELVREGRLSVNGKVVVSQGFAVSGNDIVKVDGKVLDTAVGRLCGSSGDVKRAEWIALNKRKGVLCADRDAHGRRTIVDTLDKHQRGNGVGKFAIVCKLEAVSSGLVILSTDKDCAVALNGRDCTHVREYEVIVKGHITEEAVAKLRAGVTYEFGEKSVSTMPAELDVLDLSYDFTGAAGGSRGKGVKVSIMNWRLRETRQRMIRRMCECVNVEVVSVKCLAFGPVRLGSIKKGSSRNLTPNEIKALKRGIKGHGKDFIPERTVVNSRKVRRRGRP